jgi:hypothetical protein
MKELLKKVAGPFIAMTLPLFPFEVFLGFVFLNTINKLEDIPTLLPLNVGSYK